MRKIVFTLVTILLLSSFLGISVSASEDQKESLSQVLDRDDYLTVAEEQALSEKIQAAEEETDLIFIVAVYDQRGGIPSDRKIISNCGFDATKDDVVLLVIEAEHLEQYDLVTYYYEMFTYGIASTVITDDAVFEILDNQDVYSNIKSGKFYEGSVAFIDKTVEAVKDYRARLVVILIFISLLAGAASVVIVIVTYKTKLKSPIYPLSQYTDMKLLAHSDIFLGKSVTRTKISSSSSGSSGGSGRSSGGSRGRR